MWKTGKTFQNCLLAIHRIFIFIFHLIASWTFRFSLKEHLDAMTFINIRVRRPPSRRTHFSKRFQGNGENTKPPASSRTAVPKQHKHKFKKEDDLIDKMFMDAINNSSLAG